MRAKALISWSTILFIRINEELLGQMKQMQYQMMKMNGAGGTENGVGGGHQGGGGMGASSNNAPPSMGGG